MFVVQLRGLSWNSTVYLAIEEEVKFKSSCIMICKYARLLAFPFTFYLHFVRRFSEKCYTKDGKFISSSPSPLSNQYTYPESSPVRLLHNMSKPCVTAFFSKSVCLTIFWNVHWNRRWFFSIQITSVYHKPGMEGGLVYSSCLFFINCTWNHQITWKHKMKIYSFI